MFKARLFLKATVVAMALIACAPVATAHDVIAIVATVPIPAAVTADTTFEKIARLGGAVNAWLFSVNDGVPGDEKTKVVMWQPYDSDFSHVQASISASRLQYEAGWQN